MKRIAVLLMAMCLLLSGCSNWMEGSYVSITPYLSSNEGAGQDVQWISNKDQLYDAVCYMVSQGMTEDLFFVREYTETDLGTDMLLVRYGIMSTDPIAAYAVQDIQFETGINGGRSTLAVTVTYSRQKSEILRLQNIRGMENVESAVAATLSRMDTELVFYVDDYQELDFTQMVEDFAMDNPDEVIEIPRVSVSLYPETGESRVVELSFVYQTSRDTLRTMQTQVKQIFESAKLYVSGAESDYEKLSRLYVFLTGGVDADRVMNQSEGSSITPSYSLLRYGVGDSRAFATVFTAMCRQVGLECMTVSGTRNGEAWFWNIVKDQDRYAHADILRCALNGYFRVQSDEQMVGYVWDYAACPDCVGAYQPPAEYTEDAGETEEASDPSEETADQTEPPEQTEPVDETEPAEDTVSSEPTESPEQTDATEPPAEG